MHELPRVFWVGIPQLTTKTAEKKIPRILLKIRLRSPQSAGKCPSAQLKIPASVVFPPPASFWNLKHRIRRNVGGSDGGAPGFCSSGLKLPSGPWTGRTCSPRQEMPLLFSSDLKFRPVHASVLASPLCPPPVASFTL